MPLPVPITMAAERLILLLSKCKMIQPIEMDYGIDDPDDDILAGQVFVLTKLR